MKPICSIGPFKNIFQMAIYVQITDRLQGPVHDVIPLNPNKMRFSYFDDPMLRYDTPTLET
jgi:hypothetical protein